MTSLVTEQLSLRQRFADFLAADLQLVNEVLCEQLRSSHRLVSDLSDHVGRFRGKQIRPGLLMLFRRLTQIGSQSVRMPALNAVRLAAAVEMIHTATLVHDDLIDQSDLRRHMATVHSRWDSQTAVLMGDYLFSRAFHLAASTGDAVACQLIGRATDRTCVGELLQKHVRRPDESLTSAQLQSAEVDYFRVIRGKTGCLFGLSCLLGTRSATSSRVLELAAHRYGVRLGMAFQISDDVLDLSQSCQTTGKDARNDLENGRLTLPLIRAFRAASLEERKELAAAVEQNDPLIAELPAMKRGIDSAAATALELGRRAVRDLQRFGETPERGLLEEVSLWAAGQRTA